MLPSESLVPILGCWVCRHDATREIGRVLERRTSLAEVELRVRWGSGSEKWMRLSDARCGFQPGWTVQDVPLSATRNPLGCGQVVSRRVLGGREQVLVQLDGSGRSLWLPYENLKRIRDVRLLYTGGRSDGDPERFRLRLLAHALENWNRLTGALDRLDVDPLPHQIQLVHRILSSGNHNWLIADDVGLGKTIEVGLLLAALKRRGRARRVLIVAPAGLTRQWQEELRYKFDQSYRIYGRDFTVSRPEDWKLYDHVVVSIDLAKREEHLARFREAGGWDVVVFDEGHKLTRNASGERAQRYRLAETLRPLADAFLLLSATPHQGDTSRFIALLDLVRPDLHPRLQSLEANPEIVGELILRNRKSEVTDADGNLIFKGQTIHRVAVEPSAATQNFQRALESYLARGYKAGDAGGAAGRAIGFVMTTFRKLASSSIAAIERALSLRLERLCRSGSEVDAAIGVTIADLVEGGDDQDDLASGPQTRGTREFFAAELTMLQELLSMAGAVRRDDEKLRVFCDQVVRPLFAEDKKLLVFTEYRATQSYLEAALIELAGGAENVVLINGSMDIDEKVLAIAAFDGPARCLVSTEAGGEGINLQRSCHVMVNYDLPWNPARLVQRIGRLYRYGQQQRVIVFNLQARDTFDNKALSLMLDRVQQIARDLAPVGAEFNDRLYAEILGELLETLDLASILQAASDMQGERTYAQIEEALQRAAEARGLQEDLFAYAVGFDPAALSGSIGLSMRHVESFVRGMLPLIGAEIAANLHNHRVLEVRLPETLRGRFAEFGQRLIVRITADRRLAQRLSDVVLLDFDTAFFSFLIAEAQSQDFGGEYANVGIPGRTRGILTATKLRWQNDQGDPSLEELVVLFSPGLGAVERNPAFIADWLMTPLRYTTPPTAVTDTIRAEAFGLLHREVEAVLAVSSTRFKHPNGVIHLAAADVS